MRFADPQMFHWFWLIAGFVLFLWWALGRKDKIMERFIVKDLLDEVAANYSRKNQNLKNILLIFVLIFSVIALSRPQWGFKWQEVKRQGLDILVAIDTSKSMLTQDVKPNRLERTKLAVH